MKTTLETKFIGPEYLVGNAFIYLAGGRRYLDLKVINRYRSALQRYLNLNNRNIAICRDIREAIYDYCDYFSFIPSDDFDRNAGTIILNYDITIDDLKHRFVCWLPPGIDNDFKLVAKNLLLRTYTN